MLTYSGVVGSGGRRARALGFPTANIPLPVSEVSGIFVAQASALGEAYKAVAYVDQKRGVLEVHLFGFEGDLYGKTLSVELLHKLREDRAFSSEEAAREAIADDIAQVRGYFKL